jgi:sec-independent protein translocase protein TatA
MTTYIAIGVPGGPELIFILVILLLFFGAKRLPELSRSLGRSISEFKRGRTEELPDAESEENDSEKKGPGETSA